MTARGRPLTPELKKAIVSVKQYFDQCGTEEILEASTQRTASAIGVGEATVKRIMADYNRDPSLLEREPSQRGRPSYSIDASSQEKVRLYVRKANQNGNHITLNTLRDFLSENGVKESYHIVTLARTLDRWGFEFGKGTRSQHLKEKDYVVAARQRYLRRKRKNRKSDKGIGTIRPEVYLDESYVNKNHSNDFIWYSGEDGPWVQKPTGKGERLIIVNAISETGWVPKAKLVFKSTQKTGDYHGQMNWDLFSTWFKEKLLPNIPPGSLIVMDNASYHNTLSTDSAPTPACPKDKIKIWLEHNKISCREDCLKVELVETLRKIAPEPSYAIDKTAKDFGHEILRTPPYHPELQPIELCWGVAKNHVARNCNFTMKNLSDQLEKGFESVTSETCTKMISKVRKKEDQFWNEDLKSDAQKKGSS